MAETTSLDLAIDESSQFTRLNVIGMFLTLQLCQLTQPYGSLLFRDAGGFFWRCNPIASLVEAAIIYRYLLVAIIRSWGEGRTVRLASLHKTASGLLFLRSIAGRHDVDNLLQRQRSGDASSQSDALPNVDQLPEDPQIIREAFGSNIFAHGELRIDLFTALNELFIFIKLIFVRSNGWFTSACIFLVAGWSSVQTLLILFHIQEPRLSDALDDSRKIDKSLESNSGSWMTLFYTMHLPIFGYAAHLAAYRPWIAEDASGFLGFLKTAGSWIVVIIAIPACLLGLYCMLFGIIAMLCISSRRKTGNDPAKIMLFLPAIWLFLSTLIYLLQKFSSRDFVLEERSDKLKWPEFVFDYVICQGYPHVLSTSFFALLIGAMVSVYDILFFAPLKADDAHRFFRPYPRIRTSLGNVIFTIVTITLVLVFYEPENTSKPEWLEVLG